MARDTFCFQGLSLRMPMPKPERKNSSPVVTRSHFCEASNSSTAESQMKACSLLLGGLGEGSVGVGVEGGGEVGVTVRQYNDLHTHCCGCGGGGGGGGREEGWGAASDLASTPTPTPNEIKCPLPESHHHHRHYHIINISNEVFGGRVGTWTQH